MARDIGSNPVTSIFRYCFFFFIKIHFNEKKNNKTFGGIGRHDRLKICYL
jgi:hypothetical protein